MAEYATANTEWPSTPLPSGLTPFLNDFFALLDENTDDAGIQLAARIFTPTGKFITSGGVFEGAEEIKESRKRAWDIIKERTHSLAKVYTCTEDGSDMLMIGDAAVVLVNGKPIKGNFIARMVLDKINTPDMRISYFQVWGDSGPMMKALQEK